MVSGDAVTDIDLTTLWRSHRASSAAATLGLAHVANPLEFGIVITTEDGAIERFLEKPTWGQVFSDTVNTGIYVLDPRVFDYIPEGRSVDFSGDVFPAMLAAGERLVGSVVDGYWEDVGTHEAYLAAHHDALDRELTEQGEPGEEHLGTPRVSHRDPVEDDHERRIRRFARPAADDRVQSSLRPHP